MAIVGAGHLAAATISAASLLIATMLETADGTAGGHAVVLPAAIVSTIASVSRTTGVASICATGSTEDLTSVKRIALTLSGSVEVEVSLDF